jgi:hypothetical protein
VDLVIKTLITAVIITAASEAAKWSRLFAAILVSLPLTSLLAMAWLYRDTKDTTKVVELGYTICWMIAPSLIFFLAFAACVRLGLGFVASMGTSVALMAVSYWIYTKVLQNFGITL